MAAENTDQHRKTGEGNLHGLSDDDYFDALAVMPPVYDEHGNEVPDLFADVVDKRDEKRAAAERGEEFQA